MICLFIMFLHNFIKMFNGAGIITDENALLTATLIEGSVEFSILFVLAAVENEKQPPKELIITWGKKKK